MRLKAKTSFKSYERFLKNCWSKYAKLSAILNYYEVSPQCWCTLVSRSTLRSPHVLISAELSAKRYRSYFVWKKKIFANEPTALVADVWGFKHPFASLSSWIVRRFTSPSWAIWNFSSVEVGRNTDFSFVFFKHHGGNDNVPSSDWGFASCSR